MKNTYKKFPGAMIIAGSDSIAGAGIQADIKAFHALKIHAGTVITAITAQNTKCITGIQLIDCNVIKQQIEQIDEEIDVKIVKTGMLYNADVINTVKEYLISNNNIKLILDPVMIATSGAKLLDDNSIASLKTLMSHAYIVTPNIPEAEMLSGVKIRNIQDIELAAKKIILLGAEYVLVKGAHLNESKDHIINRLYNANGLLKEITSKRIKGEFHGTGCTLASLIAGYIFKGRNAETATALAIKLLAKKISASNIKGISSSIIEI